MAGFIPRNAVDRLQSLILFSTAAITDLGLYEGGPSDQWWNPTRDGEGFYVEIITAGNSIQIGVADGEQ